MKYSLLLHALLLTLAACAAQSPVAATGSRTNLTRAAHLEQTLAIEIAQFDSSAVTPPQSQSANPWQVRTRIEDKVLVQKFARALDIDLDVGMMPACIPEYEIRFYRSDGAVVRLGYMCRRDDAYAISGEASDGSFRLGGEVRLPDAFKQLVDEQLLSSNSQS